MLNNHRNKFKFNVNNSETWTSIVVLQMLDDAGLAEGVEALGDGGGVDQVAAADLASDHLVEITKLTTSVQRITHFDFFYSTFCSSIENVDLNLSSIKMNSPFCIQYNHFLMS